MRLSRVLIALALVAWAAPSAFAATTVKDGKDDSPSRLDMKTVTQSSANGSAVFTVRTWAKWKTGVLAEKHSYACVYVWRSGAKSTDRNTEICAVVSGGRLSARALPKSESVPLKGVATVARAGGAGLRFTVKASLLGKKSGWHWTASTRDGKVLSQDFLPNDFSKFVAGKL